LIMTPSRTSMVLQDLAYVVAGILITGFAMKGFLVPNGFLDGGVTGISLLLHEINHWNLGLLLVAFNLPFIVMGAYQINRKFALKTLATVIGLALVLQFVEYPQITDQRILASIFGGFFLGVGIGLAMRAGCAIDGIEVLAVYTLRRTGFTMSEIILGINAVIFSIAAIKLGLEIALYAMLTYYIATRTIAYVIEGLEEYTGVTIISGQSETI